MMNKKFILLTIICGLFALHSFSQLSRSQTKKYKNNTPLFNDPRMNPPSRWTSEKAIWDWLDEHPYHYPSEKDGDEDDPGAAQRYDWFLTMDRSTGRPEKGRLDDGIRLINQQKAMRMSGSPGLTWTEEGPSDVGGRTRALMYDPNSSPLFNKVWAGGVDGGLWYNNDITNPTSTWTQVPNDQIGPNLAISCITHDPRPNHTNTFYVGTGEGFALSGSERDRLAVNGDGLYFSQDGGQNWTHYSDSRYQYIQKILVDSRNGDVFLATNKGLFKSASFPLFFTEVPVITSGSTMTGRWIDDLETGFDGAIWMSVHGEGVYRSINGLTWDAINQNSNILNLFDFNSFDLYQKGRIEIATSRNSPVCYVIIEGGSDVQGIFRTLDNGANWTVLLSPTDLNHTDKNFARGQADYDLIAMVDPFSPNVLYIGTINLFRTVDFGATWDQLTVWTDGGVHNRPEMHSDIHALAFRPGSNSEMVIGNDGGIYYSNNINSIPLPISVSERNQNYNVTQFYSCAFEPTGSTFIGGAQDNGTRKISNGISSRIYGGDGGFCFIDQNQPSNYIFSYIENNFYLSQDNGSTLAAALIEANTGEFINPSDYDDEHNMLFSGLDKNSINVVANVGLAGTSTYALNIPLRSNASHVKVTKELDGSTTLFIGTLLGHLFKIGKANASVPENPVELTPLPLVSAGRGYISCIATGKDNTELLVTVGNYGNPGNQIFYSNDGGITWQNKTANLPEMPVRWALFNPLECGEVMIATELGIWYTTDIYAPNSALTWVASETLNNIRVNMIKYRPSDNKVVVATFGRGIFTGSFQRTSAAYNSIGGCCGHTDEVVVSGRLYNMSNTAVFKTNQFRYLEIDNKNSIWAGSSGSGVYLMNNCTWDSVYNQFGNTGFIVRSMRKNPVDNSIWIGMSRSSPCLGYVGGIYAYTSRTNYSRYLPPLTAPNFSLASLVVRSIDFNKQTNSCWVGCAPQSCTPGFNGGLSFLNGNSFSRITNGLPPYSNNDLFINTVASGPDGKVYVSLSKSCDLNGNCSPAQIAVFNSNGTYVNSINVINSTNTSILNFSSLPNANPIRALFVDSKKRLWVAGELNGIAVMDSLGVWNILNSGNSVYVNNSIVNYDAIAEAPDGSIYFGTNSGLIKFNGGTTTDRCNWVKVFLTGLSAPNVYCIRFDKNKDFWLATSSGIYTTSQRPCFSAIANKSDIKCNGAADGSVTISSVGGCPPYTGTGTFSNLSPGTYTYAVTDFNGVVTTTSVTVSQPSPMILSTSNIAHVRCSGDYSGSVKVNATGGTLPYKGDIGTHNGLFAGTYVYTVTDANNCTQTISVTITQPSTPPLVAASTKIDIQCFDLTSGSVTVTYSGGTPPISGDTGVHNGLGPGVYSYTVIDSLGCKAYANEFLRDPGLYGPDAGQDQFICYSNVYSFTLAGNPPPAGVSAHWEVIFGSGTFFPDSLDPSPFVNHYSKGVNLYRWVYDCDSSSSADTVMIYANPLSSLDSLTITSSVNGTPFFNQINIDICQGDTVRFRRSGGERGLNGIYYWYANGCNNTAPGFDTADVITVSPSTTTTYYMSIQSNCNVTPCLPFATINVNPVGPEVCNGIDDDCNGIIDDGCGTFIYYRDLDGDGFGNPSRARVTTSAVSPAGFVSNNSDCNDYNAQSYPGAPEIRCNGFDDNCNGVIDEGPQNTYYRDADGDGYGNSNNTISACSPPPGYVSIGGDSNDNNNNINPGVIEVCNGVDDNSNGLVDEGVQSTYFRDADGDGYGTVSVTIQACSPPPGYVVNSLDCNDTRNDIRPGAAEICNGVDDNCNGAVDEGVQNVFYRDADGDGFGNAQQTINACTVPAGFVSNNTDCNDANAGIHPGSSEVCNGLDEDCDGQIDEGVTTTYFRDADGDGFGNSASTTQACSAPFGFVSNGQDCNDQNSTVHPGALEICNGADDDCDGQTDEGVQTAFYRDADGDGYGNASIILLACNVPAGFVFNPNDCDDGLSSVHPGATELCNGVDDDCDGEIDEEVMTLYYLDFDADGFGDLYSTFLSCTVPSGYVLDSSDCDDFDVMVFPGSAEVCNGIDDDCNGLIDEGCTTAILNIKLFIQGYYTGNGLMDNLGNGGCLSVSGVAGATPFESDTVRISLVDPEFLTTVATQTGIVSTGGEVTVQFSSPVTVGNNYYLKINHRNALETWSSFPVPATANTRYDFTTARTRAYGANQADLGDGNFAFYSGDINSDESIDMDDMTIMDAQILLMSTGYNGSDLNGDGIVESVDYTILLNNIITFIARP